MAKMDERLEKMAERYCEINDLMMQSDVVSDRKTMAKLGREQNELTPIVETYEEYKKAVEELEEAKVLSKEEDKGIGRIRTKNPKLFRPIRIAFSTKRS